MRLNRAAHAYASEKSRLIDRVRALNPTLANDLSALQLDWYKIRNDAESDNTDVFIYDAIGSWFGIDPMDFINEINEIKTKNISVRINSPGGSVFDSIAIYNALIKHPANITTYVDSLAASGASVIAMAGDEVVMMVGSQLMIHDALGIEIGNAKDHREFAKFLDDQSQNIASVYANKTGGDPDELRSMMLAETWMFAEEAVRLGFADRIYTRPGNAPEEDEDDKPADPTEPEEEEKEGDEKENDEEEPTDIEDLMKARHKLTNLGYKYTDRKRAPNPIQNEFTDNELDNIISGLQKALER